MLSALALILGLATSPTLPPAPSSAPWSCIRAHESGNGQTSPNLYQFQGPAFRATTGLTRSPGAYPRATQDAAALTLWRWAERYEGDGWLPWRADWRACGLS